MSANIKAFNIINTNVQFISYKINTTFMSVCHIFVTVNLK